MKNYCDIYLDATDTGAITGANARGYFGDDTDLTEYNKYVKNAEDDIVFEDSSKEFAYLDFQKNDIEIHLYFAHLEYLRL